jgi:hypothetical protein
MIPRHALRLIAAALTVGYLSANNLFADTTWQATTGSWATPGNWSAGLPSSTVNADINNGGTAQISSGTDTVGNLLLSAGTLTASGLESVGYAGTGTFTQTGGTNNLAAGSGLLLGYGSIQSGGGHGGTTVLNNYTLSGSGAITGPTSSETIESGEFDQNGGTNIIGEGLNFGTNQQEAPATYHLAAGTLSVGGITLGYPLQGGKAFLGYGNFTQGGGQLMCTGAVTIGTDSQMSIDVADTFPSLTMSEGTLYLDSALSVTGSFTEASASPYYSQLYFDIGGTTPGTQYSSLTVGGEATLSGGLSVSLANSFVPSYGEVFNIINYGSYTGSFLNPPVLQSGSWGHFALAYTPTGVTLTVVPEPCAIRCIASCGLLFMRRRKGFARLN